MLDEVTPSGGPIERSEATTDRKLKTSSRKRLPPRNLTVRTRLVAASWKARIAQLKSRT